jgi:amidase
MGGSLRNPASFCNVVGLRPSIGRVPDDSRAYGWFSRLDTRGPMGRTVDDVALLLSVQAGPAVADPLSLAESGATFRTLEERDLSGTRVGWSPDLGLPVDPAVKAVMHQVAANLQSLGCKIETRVPDFSGAMDVFNIQRGAQLASLGRSLDAALPDWRRHAKDTAVWNIDFGLDLTAETLLRAEIERTRIYRRITRYFEEVDALFIPAAQVPPFDASLDWVREIDGTQLPTYLDWMQVCCVISITGLPTISVPAGFTNDGLPVGVQIVGKPRDDKALLEVALAFERATGLHRRRPPVC